MAALVALLGTTISPYLFFWQASSEVDEMRAAGKRTEVDRHGVRTSELRAARADILIGMFFSNLVMYFIIVTTAAVLHAHGRTEIQSADRVAYRPTFYLIIAVSTLAGIGINLVGINPIRALFVTAIINGIVAPPL